MSDTTSNCAWVCSRCGAFVFSGTGHLCPSQRASTELMSDVQNEILDNLRTIRDQTQQIAQLEAERDRLRDLLSELDKLCKHLGWLLTYSHQKRIDAALAASEQGEPK